MRLQITTIKFTAQASKRYIPTWRWFRASAQGRRSGSICETPSSNPRMKRNIQEGQDSEKEDTKKYNWTDNGIDSIGSSVVVCVLAFFSCSDSLKPNRQSEWSLLSTIYQQAQTSNKFQYTITIWTIDAYWLPTVCLVCHSLNVREQLACTCKHRHHVMSNKDLSSLYCLFMLTSAWVK